MTAALGVFKKSNFAPAFFLLPERPRRALQAIYAFCREVDDVVDNEVQVRAEGRPLARPAKPVLEDWRALLRSHHTAVPGPHVNPAVWAPLEEALAQNPVGTEHLLGLIDGVERDLVRTRYETFDELKTYCYGVAGTVGMACLAVFRLDEDTHRPFAENLGYAVQLTNILRDVKVDAARDRIYLPLEDLKRFDYSVDELKRSVYNDAFVRLMRFEAARAEEFYAKAMAALPPISRPAARTALVMGALYRALLEKMKRKDFRVFDGKTRLSTREKLKAVWGVLKEGWRKS